MKPLVCKALNIYVVLIPCLCLLEKNGKTIKYLAFTLMLDVTLAQRRAFFNCKSYSIESKACTIKPSTCSITNL